MKKRRMLLCLCLIVLSTTACKKKTESKENQNNQIEQGNGGDQIENPQGNENTNEIDDKVKEEAYETTQKEIDLLFANSCYYEHKLLDSPPKGSQADIINILTPTNCNDTFYIGQYKDSFYISAINIESTKLDFLGISPGDSKDIISEKLKDTTFQYTDTREEDRTDFIEYSTALLSLTFEVNKEGIIESISASVYDPYIPDEERVTF